MRGGRGGGARNLQSLAASCRPRCLVATVVSRQPCELMDADGRLRLDKHLQDQLMRVLELEIDLGVSKQRLKLAPPESCPEHVEEGPLPTLQRQLVLPENARVLGFKYNEVGSSEKAAPCHLFHLWNGGVRRELYSMLYSTAVCS